VTVAFEEQRAMRTIDTTVTLSLDQADAAVRRG